MGSIGNQKSWTPYDAYKDCAEGICNIYCPQWCNYQPPLDSGDDSGTSFSPLIIAVIGILASAFLLVSYYAVITKYCRRRRGSRSNSNVEGEAQLNQMNHHDQLQVNSNGLDEGLIKSIMIVQYKKGVGLVEGTECSVCLNDFQENEDLRLLPKCFHAFHLPCIDTWLKSHSNCPLCRANAAPVTAALPPPPPIPPPETPSSLLTISSLETRRQNDHLVLVIDEEELIDNQEVCVNGVLAFVQKNDVGSPAARRNNKFLDQDGSRQLRRSISLGTFSTRSGLMVADILQMNEEDEEIKVEIQQQLEMKMDSSNGVQEEVINGGRSSDSEIPFHK